MARVDLTLRGFAALAAPVALAGCNLSGDDGYAYKQDPDFVTQNRFVVEIVEYSSQKQLDRSAIDYGVPQIEYRKDKAFAFVSPGRCQIHVLNPLHGRLWWGHELVHCAKGRWHD